MDFVFTTAKGRVNELGALPGATDSLIAVPLEASALQADTTLQDYQTLTEVLAANTAQVDMGRLMIAPTSTIDFGVDTRGLDADDVVFSAATGNPTGKLILCYSPSDTATDADIIPLCAYDFVRTPNGSDIPVIFDAAGFYSAS